MKKILLFILLLATTAQFAIAQNRNAAMQIQLRDNNMLTVVIDGRQYNKYGYGITISDLSVGNHDIKVYRYYPAQNNNGYGRQNNTAHAALAYRGSIRLMPATMYYCTVDAVNKTMSIRESRTISYNRDEKNYDFDGRYSIDEEQRDPYDVYEDRRNNNDRNDRRNDERVNYDQRKDNEYNNRDRRNDNRVQLMSASEMQNLENSVDNRMGDDNKRKLMENYLSNKNFSSGQVATMCSWLSFESTKLSFAKYCFPLVQDQDNYLQVSDLFSFQSSKSELEALMFANKNNNRNDRGGRNTTTKNNLLNTDDMVQLRKSVSEKITDTDKQKLMQQYLNSKKMSSSQVGEMLDWLTFEGSKLEFAKWCFQNVTDPNNYLLLKSKFSFTSSKNTIEELALRATRR